jgi:hypothetical protein
MATASAALQRMLGRAPEATNRGMLDGDNLAPAVSAATIDATAEPEPADGIRHHMFAGLALVLFSVGGGWNDIARGRRAGGRHGGGRFQR